jgi:hypothetical protein
VPTLVAASGVRAQQVGVSANVRVISGDAAITARSDAWTTIVAPSGEGMSLTYKKRQ